MNPSIGAVPEYYDLLYSNKNFNFFQSTYKWFILVLQKITQKQYKIITKPKVTLLRLYSHDFVTM